MLKEESSHESLFRCSEVAIMSSESITSKLLESTARTSKRQQEDEEDGLATNNIINPSRNQLSMSLETALQHLQPIRDLSRNWDVDIASCLEDVLKDLASSKAATAVDRTSTSTSNFSQAAILLQNAGFVYSRKVEYLYNLVLLTIKDLNNNSDSSNSRKRTTASSTDLDEFDAFDPELQFLLLDDVLPTAVTKTSSSKHHIDLIEEDGHQQTTPSSPTEQPNMTYLSLGGIMPGSKLGTPFASPLGVTTSQKNDIHIANIVRDTLALQSNSANNVLRLVGNTCSVDSKTGALLIPGSNLVRNTTPFTSYSNPNTENKHFDYDDDHDNDYDIPFNLEDREDGNNSSTDQNNQQQHQPSVEVVGKECRKIETGVVDPWTSLLDPHDPGCSKPRPLKVGITYKLPPTEDTGNTKHIDSISYIPEEIQVCKDTGKIIFIRTLEKPPLLGLAFGNEFSYMANANKRKERLARTKQKILAQTIEMPANDNNNNNMFDYDDGDDDDDGGAYENDDNNYGNIDHEVEGNVNAAILEHCFDGNHAEKQNVFTISEQHKTFEELCREHMKEFAKKADKYAADTQLSKRVSKWQSQLLPILELEEERPDFDIHKYGQSIMKTLSEKKSKVVDFQILAKDSEQYGVCRLFLSALMLCNSDNIALKNTNYNGLQVELLNPDFNAVAVDALLFQEPSCHVETAAEFGT